MTIRQSLQLLDQLAQTNGLARPYLVGGMVRDFHLGLPEHTVDIDITTGNHDAAKLAKLFAAKTGEHLHGEEHFFVTRDSAKYDFSKDFSYPGIDVLLKEKGVEKPTDLQRETFSRDFTINSLLRSLDFQEEMDLTGRGISDIKNLLLVCPVDCDVSFRHDPRRILRAYHFKAKFGFKFSKQVADSIVKNRGLLSEIEDRYAGEMVNKIVRENDAMLDELIDSGILQQLKLTNFVTDLLLKRRKLLDVLQ